MAFYVCGYEAAPSGDGAAFFKIGNLSGQPISVNHNWDVAYRIPRRNLFGTSLQGCPSRRKSRPLPEGASLMCVRAERLVLCIANVRK